MSRGELRRYGWGIEGSESYLSGEQRQAVEEWVGTHDTVSVEEVRDYIEEQYGVVYRSKQSYYELLEAGEMCTIVRSPDKSEA